MLRRSAIVGALAAIATSVFVLLPSASAQRLGRVNCTIYALHLRTTWRPGAHAPIAAWVENNGSVGGYCELVLTVDVLKGKPLPGAPFHEVRYVGLEGVQVFSGHRFKYVDIPPGLKVPADRAGSRYRLRACAHASQTADAFPQDDCAPPVEVRVRSAVNKADIADPTRPGSFASGGTDCSADAVHTRPTWRADSREPITIDISNNGSYAGWCFTTLFIGGVGEVDFTPTRWDIILADVPGPSKTEVAPDIRTAMFATPGILVPADAARSTFLLQACSTAEERLTTLGHPELYPENDCSPPVHVRVRAKDDFPEPVLPEPVGSPGLDCSAEVPTTVAPWRVGQRNILTVYVFNHGTVAGYCWVSLTMDALAGKPLPLGARTSTPVFVRPGGAAVAVTPPSFDGGMPIPADFAGSKYRVQACATGKPIIGVYHLEAHPEDDCARSFDIEAAVDPLAGVWSAGALQVTVTATAPDHFVGVVTATPPAPADPSTCRYSVGDRIWDITAQPAADYHGTAATLPTTSPCGTQTVATTWHVDDVAGSWELESSCCATFSRPKSARR